MATLATQVIPDTGLEVAYVAAAAGGDKCATGPGCFLHVVNDGGGALTVTLVTPQVLRGDLAVGDRTVSVTAGESRMIAVPAFYASPADNLASITYSGVTSVTVAALRV